MPLLICGWMYFFYFFNRMRSRESVSGDGARSFLESNMFKLIKKLGRDERGVSALEYAVLAAVVVSAVIAAGNVLGGSSGLSSVFTSIMSTITGKVTSSTSSSST